MILFIFAFLTQYHIPTHSSHTLVTVIEKVRVLPKTFWFFNFSVMFVFKLGWRNVFQKEDTALVVG